MGRATFEELNSHLWLVAFSPEQHMVMSSKVWHTAEGWIKEETFFTLKCFRSGIYKWSQQIIWIHGLGSLLGCIWHQDTDVMNPQSFGNSQALWELKPNFGSALNKSLHPSGLLYKEEKM